MRDAVVYNDLEDQEGAMVEKTMVASLLATLIVVSSGVNDEESQISV